MTPSSEAGFSILPADFFHRSAPDVAESIVGLYLLTRRDGSLCGGKVVECEAYLGPDDPASHAACGPTDRNRYMFGPGGVVYVYMIYGLHLCFNVTAGKDNEAGAVLIRSLEPEYGVEKMEERRGVEDLRRLTTGPANLTRALEITLNDNGKKLPENDIFFAGVPGTFNKGVVRTPRIGISKARHLKYRFLDPDSNFISGPAKYAACFE